MESNQIPCICGSTDIEHAFDDKWKCDDCGRFHDGEAMDRLADNWRAQS